MQSVYSSPRLHSTRWRDSTPAQLQTSKHAQQRSHVWKHVCKGILPRPAVQRAPWPVAETFASRSCNVLWPTLKCQHRIRNLAASVAFSGQLFCRHYPSLEPAVHRPVATSMAEEAEATMRVSPQRSSWHEHVGRQLWSHDQNKQKIRKHQLHLQEHCPASALYLPRPHQPARRNSSRHCSKAQWKEKYNCLSHPSGQAGKSTRTNTSKGKSGQFSK